MLKKLLSNSRYLVIVPVFGLLVSSIALMGTGGYKIVKIVIGIVNGELDTKLSMLGFLETADLFLLAVALYLIALGLYDLFIDPDIEMPEWLTIRDLTDLKKKLLEVVVMILAVVFLGKVVNWEGGMDVFYLGAGIALVIAALTIFNKK
ncbi:MAG: YqhA family protein [Saprospiraceae bacterium]|nr:YqhA family protein [Saprospiraceae bacterium]MCF8252036.1 YqhA family protein [Saprospiraceae bacterium]MCF8281725.1 YqhA family protein [Bacteroidales bacterium]MCF8310387.1 YqhA family protein [Saprospiraceae bacterium]MCF8439765.1 YqhA family protein [Saprospiraceae bacterium]